MKKQNIKIEKDFAMLLTEFQLKLQKINNENVRKQLEELFKTNKDEAFQQYRIELAKQIYKQNENLFKRLSNL